MEHQPLGGFGHQEHFFTLKRLLDRLGNGEVNRCRGEGAAGEMKVVENENNGCNNGEVHPTYRYMSHHEHRLLMAFWGYMM